MVKKSYCIHLDKVLMDKLKKTDDNLSGRINLLIRNYLNSLKKDEVISTNKELKELKELKEVKELKEIDEVKEVKEIEDSMEYGKTRNEQ